MSSVNGTTGSLQWWTVFRREFIVRVTNKTFLISTGVMVVVLIGSIFLMGGISEDSPEAPKVAVSDSASAHFVENLEPTSQDEVVYQVEHFDNQAAAREAVTSGDADMVLSQSASTWIIGVSPGEKNSQHVAQLSAALSDYALQQKAQQMGINLQELIAGTAPHIVEIDSTESGAGATGASSILLPLAFGMVFYMAVILFGTSIAQSVVTEKESRIVEILAAAVSLRSLLVGKILATSLLAFSQIALFALVISFGLTWQGVSFEGLELTSAIAWFIPFFVIGFLGLASVWAAAGSLASRTEDLQSTSMPLTLVLVGVLLAPNFLQEQGEKILSFMPLFNVSLMPYRIISGATQWWEPVVALGGGIIFCALMLLLGERLYRRSIMHTGGKMGWVSALKK